MLSSFSPFRVPLVPPSLPFSFFGSQLNQEESHSQTFWASLPNQ